MTDKMGQDEPAVSDNLVDLPRLIRSIQIIEGNMDCFGTARDGNCDRLDCSWREFCLKKEPDAN